MEPLSASTLARIQYPVETMNVSPPYVDTPRLFVEWLLERRPNVVFLNNCDAMDDCIPYIPAEVRCVYVVHDTMSFYWKAAVRHEDSLDAIVAVSHETARHLRDKLKRPEKLRVIQNGTAFPSIDNVNASLAERDLTFLGGDDPRKGADDVLQIWPRLVKGGFSGRLHWYGPVSDEFKQRIAELPIAGNISLYGHVPREEVFRRLNISSALLMLSRAEAFGMVLLEAMSMGSIPVVWNCKGIAAKEIIPEEFRFMSPLGHYDHITRQIFLALSSRDRCCQRMAEYARTHFSDEVMWSGYRSMIDEILANPLAVRPCVRQVPEKYSPPFRASYLIPRPLWRRLRPMIARSPRVYSFLRNLLCLL